MKTRRTVIKVISAAAVSGSALLAPGLSFATTEEVEEVLKQTFGSAPIKPGRVTLKLPPLAENGNSVPLTVSVESPMTAEDYVESVHILSEVNPVPTLAVFHLGPRSGRAEVSTRVRLADTQVVRAVAKMSDGTLWSGSAETIVTLAACIDLGL